MKVFISWSGNQSHAVAKALRDWLGSVVPGVTPWLSASDIPAGARWFNEVMQQLETTSFCVICLTPDNMRSPWLYFEAGAIAARHKDAKVCGFLTGVTPSQVSGPITQFQCVSSDAEGTWAMVREINATLGNKAHDEGLISNSFVLHWPRLRENLREALLLYDPRSSASEIDTEPQKARYKLSEESQSLLLEACEDKNGIIMMIRTMSGLTIQTNGKQMCDRQDARSVAKWQGGVRELIQHGLIEGRGHKGEVFGVTAEGFRVADEISATVEGTK